MANKMELLRNILTIKVYLYIAVAAAAGLGAIYYLLTMSLLSDHLGVAVDAAPIQVITTIGLTVLVSALGGINVAVAVYRVRRIKMANSARTGSSAILGGASAAFTPGCPACTAPLAIVLGAVGGLAAFPMQGLELKIISASVLAFSIYWMLRGIQKQSCCHIK